MFGFGVALPVPRDQRVRRSRGDAGEGDGLLVIGRGVEGLLEHRQHWRHCTCTQRRNRRGHKKSYSFTHKVSHQILLRDEALQWSDYRYIFF